MLVQAAAPDVPGLRLWASPSAPDRDQASYQTRKQETGLDRAMLREMGALGFIGPELPEEYGGLGLTNVGSGVVIEALSYGDFNVAYMQSSGALLGQVIARNASKAVASQWVAQIVQGEKLLGIGLTERSAGSDAARPRLKAECRNDRYILAGEKTSISMADQADGFVVFARTGTPEDGGRGVTAFLVPSDSKGLSRTRFNDLGSKIVGRGSLFFDEPEFFSDRSDCLAGAPAARPSPLKVIAAQPARDIDGLADHEQPRHRRRFHRL